MRVWMLALVLAAAIAQRVDNLDLAALTVNASVDKLVSHWIVMGNDAWHRQEQEQRAQDRREDDQRYGYYWDF